MRRVFSSSRNVAGVSVSAVLAAVAVSAGVPSAPAVAQWTMAEATPLSNEELADRAEVVVHGTVEAIDIERVLSNLFDDRTYLATFVVDRVERAEDIEPGDRIRVRYWRRSALDGSVTDSVAGYMPLPEVGAASWLFASGGDDDDYAPIMPNGWNPDVATGPDPTGLYGGTETIVRDQRTGSMTPWAIGMLAVSVLVGLTSLRAGPQSRAAMLLVAAGVALSGVILLVW